MTLKATGTGDDWREIDRFERDGDGRAHAGFGWIAHPEEAMQRASHALAVDGEVYVVDPVDAAGIDEQLAELGTVAGVVVLLDRHRRDAAALANRHDVPVYVPGFMSGIADRLSAPVETVGRELGESGYTVHEVVDNPFWTEAALYSEASGTLVVPEAVGTADFFLASGESLGVHPGLRLTPPRRLGRLDPDRVLVGHGVGIHGDATATLRDALSGARRRTPGLALRTIRTFLPV